MAGRNVEAWVAGIAAGRDGEPSQANPYERGSEEASHWADGWRDGERQRVAKTRAAKARANPTSDASGQGRWSWALASGF